MLFLAAKPGLVTLSTYKTCSSQTSLSNVASSAAWLHQTRPSCELVEAAAQPGLTCILAGQVALIPANECCKLVQPSRPPDKAHMYADRYCSLAWLNRAFPQIPLPDQLPALDLTC